MIGREQIRASVSFIGGGGPTTHPMQEMHLVTAGEVAAGYFTLAHTPETAGSVAAYLVGGIRQVNKQDVGGTGATPDFDVLSGNRLHVNNNGGATGLSGDIEANDVLIIDYRYT